MAVNKVVIVFNEQIYQSFSANITKYRQFAYVKPNSPHAVSVPLPIDSNHVLALSKVADGKIIVPGAELTSHLDVYTFLRFAEWAGVSPRDVAAGMAGWTANPTWVGLGAPEYMYSVWNMSETLVDFNKWFREAVDPYEVIGAMLQAPTGAFDAETLINALQYYTDFNLASIFEEGDEKTRNRLAMLRDARRLALNVALVDPYTLGDYFRFTPSPLEVWSCTGISSAPRFANGDATIASPDQFKANFRDFTKGLLDVSPNPELRGKEFPWANVAVCGGGALQMLNAKYAPKRSSDVDLFIYGKSFEEKSEAFKNVMEWFRSDKTIYAMIGSVMTVYVLDIDRKFQIVNTNNKSIYEVIGRFDLSHIQHAIRKEDGALRVYSTAAACMALRDHVARFVCVDRARTDRIIKALYMGWDVYKEKRIVDEVVDITQLITPPDNQNLRRELLKFQQYFHPKSDMEASHIEGMILLDAKATFVTRDINFAINNIVLNGNFTTDYEAMMFTNFNDGALVHQGVARRHFRTQLKDRSGAVRLMSGELKVTGIIHGEDKTEIICECHDPLFIEHVNRLERNTYRQFSNQPVTVHMFDQNGKMQLFIDRARIDMQTTRGTTILKAKKGKNLNLDEDLFDGDTIQMIYTIVAEATGDARFMKLQPWRLIKVNEHIDKDDELVEQNNNEAVGKDIANAAARVDECEDIKIDIPIAAKPVAPPVKEVKKIRKVVPKAAAKVGVVKAAVAKPVARAPSPKHVRGDQLDSDEGSE